MLKLNPLMLREKWPDNFDVISESKAKLFKKDLKDKYYSEHYQQFSFKYFVSVGSIRDPDDNIKCNS